MEYPKQKWQGKNGNTYEFTVYPIDISFKSKVDGNYIFAKQTMRGWDAVYIGEGDLKTRTEAHKNDGCVLRKGATHIHAHTNNNEEARKQEESDLLGFNSEAYEPNGCNVKIGG